MNPYRPTEQTPDAPVARWQLMLVKSLLLLCSIAAWIGIFFIAVFWLGPFGLLLFGFGTTILLAGMTPLTDYPFRPQPDSVRES